ncbi:matrixin family metalloprotease [Alicyclobacillus cycloheptanicus]|jgi:hypothetical protein|uniref:Uncharacterized protein n=1 Tax=Alicyclobacillus cycloheptanicus TaxID=1457 RepID=A0ABT9XH61_9BACL|nr:matrixin family metalloprotease [Alicyclobacillus cycloheptanicus]MDQ0189076.1 hypothetical protein [Alicyclobacillus cycloheptanicus]WDM00211.1 matrixin family metalloprotease [Alicyclobacillus cycloheptanicus]
MNLTSPAQFRFHEGRALGLELCAAPGLAWLLPRIAARLADVYGRRVSCVVDAQPKGVTPAALDAYSGAADVNTLLAGLSSGRQTARLWVVDHHLSHGLHVRLGGVSGDGTALVSAKWAGPEGAVSIAAHEVGHLLGLAHCRRACLMHPVHTPAAALRRTTRLCASCVQQLEGIIEIS